MTETRATYSSNGNTDQRWPQVLETLKGAMSKNQFNSHFKGSRGKPNNSGQLIICLPPGANIQAIQAQLGSVVDRAIQPIYGNDCEIVYQPQLSNNLPAPSPDKIQIRDVRKKQPFFMVENSLYRDGHAAQMKASGLAVYLCLIMHSNSDNICWPSYATIAKLTGMTRRSVITQIKNLEGLGYIAIKKNMHDGEFTSNTILILNFPKI